MALHEGKRPPSAADRESVAVDHEHETLARVCRAADDAGFDSIWVMDHLFQIRSVGEIEEPMLEGMTDARLHGRVTPSARGWG